ncbi:MAG: GntR family transcriptional regulator [Atopobiaceae bacterium]|jgi:DNA-binding GntR family transcriptional regulator|nr:GntR family transcriptional regulator [Atopobiaceae bacterium]MCI1318843.1 GntR family transcriptional regulator [Atopobiaceae bacterium]MCI1389747.1 GntR family transcriptional regulator [Atopobiaceae bacterium]MCI1432715.1 GntR family transcriptional regulator [Atopobiaceae bacterium]MCI1470948.1 GntR family transcriptional regulator [Atopobiaceae bacterium]
MADEPQTEFLYSNIENDLRQKILSGEFGPGERLPTEAELCEQYGVSRITVRRAIKNLVDDDMLRRYRGKGTFVRPKLHELDANLQNNLGFTGLTSLGGKANRHIIEAKRIPASATVAAKLGIPQGNEVQYVKRQGIVDGVPLTLDNVYVSTELLPTFIDDLKEGNSLYGLFEQQYKLKLAYAGLSFSAAIATQEEAKLLDCFTGAPLLVFDKVCYNTDGKVVHYSKTYLSGNRTSEHLCISRAGQLITDEPPYQPPVDDTEDGDAPEGDA